jgi:glucose/arabinose dehydrogenase
MSFVHVPERFTGGLAGYLLPGVGGGGLRTATVETLVRDMGRIRDVRQGPDGLIYLAIDHRGGERTPILRLEPAG